MKILIACKLPDAALNELRSLATVAAYEPDIRPEDLPAALDDVGILVVDRRRVGPECIAAASALQMIIRAGTSTANIALDEASLQGVFVTNCPLKDADAIAELTLGLVVALDRGLIEHAAVTRPGKAAPSGPGDARNLPEARGLAGRTIGILGFGAVCRQVARRAQAFDMNVLAWSANMTSDTQRPGDVEFCYHPRELARRSDVVTVYAPPERVEEPLIGPDFISSLRDGALVVHVGNPRVLDEAALAAALKAGRIRVASDVYSADADAEGGRLRSRLAELPGTIVTQRLASATGQARAAIADEVVRIVRQFLVFGEVVNCVNLMERSPARWQLVLRLKDAVGVMAAIMDAIRADGVNAEEITSRVFTGARAAWCAIALDERPSNETLDTLRSLPGVMHLQLRAMM